MHQNGVEIMEPAAAARVLEKSLGPRPASKGSPERAPDPRWQYTIADAAAKSGLALRDAERGLHALLAQYRGHLRVTSEGELLFLFPNGFTTPWLTRSRLERAAGRVKRAAFGIGRFVV